MIFASLFFHVCFGLAMARLVKNLTIHPLCQKQVITVVSGSLPGPTIRVHEDGPEYATQCPIRPSSNELEVHLTILMLSPKMIDPVIFIHVLQILMPLTLLLTDFIVIAAADNSASTTGIIVYKNVVSLTPQMPVLPAFDDTPTAYKFSTSLTALVNAPHWVPVPLKVDEHMFVAISLGLIPCERNNTCAGLFDQKSAASMNNASFQFPTKLSMLQAFFNNRNRRIIMTSKSTKVKKLKFNSTVEMVLQNTASLGIEMHPMHLHGFNFHVLAQGFGNYDPINDAKNFNLINPQARNTIGVPTRGWVVIRFQANNPGIWLMHCHMDAHLPWGLSMAFEVENGPTPSTTLPPRPLDLPQY
ncbi:unnamed protein product [Camellia sinensis]